MPYALMTKVCEQCGSSWQTRTRTSRYCSKKCSAVAREMRRRSPGRAKREYPEEIVQRVRELYDAGYTVVEIGREVGPGVKAQLVVERYVAQRRPAIPRDQRWESGSMWKGDLAGYQALHLRVANARGKPSKCERCGRVDDGTKYEWANLTGHYEDLSDYQRMCIPCHRTYDADRRRESGMRTSIWPPEEVMPYV